MTYKRTGGRTLQGCKGQDRKHRRKLYYYRGLSEYQNGGEKGYLIDTCLNSQDNYEKLVNYFLKEE